ncbi:NADH:flavin oxidoreductase/NADH oxidase [Streptomyces sp. PTD5-9]|uniref:NADH:flavin oxidoreductase/NADH oxidase n=1 Tax=Streptomyces sp. PTD5-9 TaxID=3120150 RepID=UPI003008BB5F
MTRLFEPLTLRGATLRNRAWVSPMCQHSADDGHPTDWHLVHLGSRAVGGAGLVMAESTAIDPAGRISPYDTGLWDDAHIDSWARVTRFVAEQGAVPAVQLSHAGRKASTRRPWTGRGPLPAAEGGWPTVGPSPLAHGDLPAPRALTAEEIGRLPGAFADAAGRALAAGFGAVELHAAHGYLLHQFLSPLSNRRDDAYGGSFARRTRLALAVVEAVRERLPDRVPLLVRVSATDWTDGGWDIEQTVELARLLKERGVDLVDTSTGGNTPSADIPVAPGYQVPFAARIRREAGVPTAAVGLITTARQAENVLADGSADAVMLARATLDDPYWARRAARSLGRPTAVPIAPYDRPDLRRGTTSPALPGTGR